MALYARVSGTTVVNLVSWDGVSPYNVSPDVLVLATSQPNAQIGGTYANGVFTAPAAPAPPQGIVFVNSPTSGASIQLPNAPQPQAKLYAYLQPAAALAALTLQMPPSPLDGDVLNLLSSKAITSLTFSPTFSGAPTTLAAGATGAQQMTYSAQLGNWFLW
jgi:hypothetical protein